MSDKWFYEDEETIYDSIDDELYEVGNSECAKCGKDIFEYELAYEVGKSFEQVHARCYWRESGIKNRGYINQHGILVKKKSDYL